MYEEHPAAKPPDNPECAIWRYLDFTKLVSLLNSGALFFPRLTALQDRFEGSLTRPIVDDIMKVPPDATKAAFVERMQKAGKSLSTFAMARQLLFVSSWYVGEHESAAMWRLYSQNAEGVALRSTFGRFRDSITDSRGVSIGMIRYVDYEVERIEWNNIYFLGLHKRLSFAYENELRGIMMENVPNGPGINVSVDLNKLIEAVYVSPVSAPWFEQLVNDVIQRYGYQWPVRKSILGQDPLY